MSLLVAYKSVQVLSPDPHQPGGLALNSNFKALADADFIRTGAWSAATAYVPNQLATRLGRTWLCILARSATATTPDADPTHWALWGASGESFDQALNTTNSPSFVSIGVQGTGLSDTDRGLQVYSSDANNLSLLQGTIQVDLNTGNLKLNAPVVLNVLSAPPAPEEALIYYDSVQHKIGVFNGTGWQYLGGGATPSYPKRWRGFHDSSIIESGSALEWLGDGGQSYYGEWRQPYPGAIGDKFSQSIFVASGTYTLMVLGVKVGNAGIVTWSVDGVDVGTTDFYASSNVNNAKLTVPGIVIATGGAHKLEGRTTGKNGASGAYQIQITYMDMAQASD